ncbi:putative imidazole glycerol phosphate synthase, glutamine amidotransferase subunit [Leptospira weilii str. 2006001855]|uniref:Putative imidazole glycerol phosphate synthase, glutamine amidotransferase subunit n=1 Tax=Leptospira weilii str. 2006001855 TaxID=996804 RepID=M6FTH8_9LEPT|nr:putative imidazole glycerol phosphate synthase, glutamine amidotransferase subunit [Leptospira weilii str. 2006001855]
MIAILDYGMGNIHSCIKAVSLYTKDFVYTKNRETIENSKALILPGDGHFDKAMENLSSTGLRETIDKHVNSGKPLFGICIGFQILFESSEEIAQDTKKERIEGLGYIKGKVKKFQGKDFKVPHIGWNRLQIRRKDKSILLKGISDQSFFISSIPTDRRVQKEMRLPDFAITTKRNFRRSWRKIIFLELSSIPKNLILMDLNFWRISFVSYDYHSGHRFIR